MKCFVKIGSLQHQGWGYFEGGSFEEIARKVKEQIENLTPLNSSPKGIEEYRNRFRGKPIFIQIPNSKEYKQF